MEPLSPNDPLHTLLGRARPVEPRPNFTQNVMRAIRQMPQSFGFWERMQAWLGGLTMPRTAVAGLASVVIIGGLVAVAIQKRDTPSLVVAKQSQAPANQAQPQVPIQTPIYHVSAAMILAATAEVATPAASASPSGAKAEEADPVGLLLVQEDSSALTDGELALLVY